MVEREVVGSARLEITVCIVGVASPTRTGHLVRRVIAVSDVTAGVTALYQPVAVLVVAVRVLVTRAARPREPARPVRAVSVSVSLRTVDQHLSPVSDAVHRVSVAG